MAKRKIIVVGGGFGGLKAALILCKDPRVHVTLISENPDFRVYGSLYRVATGGSLKIASVPIDELTAQKNISLVHAKATQIDRTKRIIKTDDKQTFFYDAVIFAIGVTTNFFGIKGLEEYAFGIKTPRDAEALKEHLHRQLIDTGRPDLNYVVIGGGPTGVELAGVLPSYIRKICDQHNLPRRRVHVDLIEASPRLLPRMPRDISRRVKRHLKHIGIHVQTKKVVQAQTADALMVDNKPIRSHTVIWTAGVMNNPFFKAQGFQLASNGRVRVDQFLQAEPGIYVIGDNADTPYSGMAQVALEDGAFVAKNLMRMLDGNDPKPYKAKKPIYVMPAGPRWAAVLWGKVRLYGLAGWILRRAADFIAYHDYEPWQSAIQRWLAESEEEESCHICLGKLGRVMYESGEI